MDALANLIVLGLAVRVVVTAASSLLPIGRWRSWLRPQSRDPKRMAECAAELSRVAAQIAVLRREAARTQQDLLVESLDGEGSPAAASKRARLRQIDELMRVQQDEQRRLAEERRALQPSASTWREAAGKFLVCDFCHHFWASVLVVCAIGDGRMLTVLAAAGAGYLIPARLRMPTHTSGCTSGSCGASKRG